ncbi:hypothetical protein LCGC14_1893640 [marine sediment metagenome]|uniref:Uncharacterized protein n=1 Tax=marine sediment metagenome TaxID=412755 RepID=A0A0F9FYN9_9ZZZZ
MAKEYKVLSIDELTRTSPAKGVEKYYRHTIQTTSGTVLTVDVNEEDFTPEKTAPILQAAAINADTIKKG